MVCPFVLKISKDLFDFLKKWQEFYGDPLAAWWWEWFEKTPQYQQWLKSQRSKS